MFKKSDLYFLLGFALMAATYYHDFINRPPQNIHIWRQTDCLSIAKMYQEGAPLFEPEMHAQFGDKFQNGKTAGEFPILYYIVGNIWKITGFTYGTYRWFYLIILFIGTFSLYRSLLILFNSEFWSIASSLLLFTSPVFAYYGVSFLTDVPSVCFILMGLYALTLYKSKERKKYFWISISLFTLAGLIKISSLIIPIFLGLILLLDSIPNIKTLGDRKMFQKPKIEWIGFTLMLVTIFLWYQYAHFYNEAHGFKYTFNDVHPYWIMEDDEANNVISGIKDMTSIVLFSRPMLWLLFFIGVFNITNFKSMSLFAYLANIVVACGIMFYILLWFPLLGVHDYYFSVTVVALLSTLIPFIYYLKEHTLWFQSKKIKTVFTVFLIVNFLYCGDVMNLKKFSDKESYYLVGNQNTIELMKWFNGEHEIKTMRYERMTKHLSEIGVTADKKIICFNDPSFNISLFLADRKGWTAYMPITDELMQDYIANGAEYLLIDQESSLQIDYMQKYIVNQIGNFEGVRIYKLP